VTSRRWFNNLSVNVPMIPWFGGAEGDRTPDLLSAIHATEILADHAKTLANLKEQGGCPACLSS
jgi:hypothetical protein